MTRLWIAPLGALLAAGWIAGPGAFSATCQDPPAATEEAAEASRIHLPGDRALSRGMQRAQESIAAGEFSQAIGFLDGVLGREEDLFVDIGAGGRQFAGMKETARRLIRDLPPEGRQAYEAAYGAAAERMLKSAVDSGDPAALQLVAQRYFYTPAGYEAAFLLAMDEADAGRHLSAALNYQQLLDSPEAVRLFDPQLSVRAAASWLAAGEEERARQVLDGLLARGQQTIEVAGREYRLDTTSEPLTWLRETVGEPADVAAPQERQWLIYRGNAARNGATSGGLPHMRVRWKVRLLGHPQLESVFENFLADLTRTGNMAPVASNALAAGDYILTRTPHGLLAVDFRTGKRVWRSEPQREPELERLMNAGSVSEEEAANPEPARSFARRMWEDYLYGLVSSDGARVYMINDLPMPAAQDFEMTPFMATPGIEEKSQANRLSAYELATQGKRIWKIDGAAATGELAGVFFLGAPLPVGQSLYIMAEKKSAVYLLALDRTTGEFQWQQRLVDMETNVSLDLRRRLQSAMPSYESGMIVCPTGAGLVVGVDLAKRSLAWVYQYGSTQRPDEIYRGRHDEGSSRLTRRWLDTATTIVGDRVLLTPPESDQLHCIDLRTGRLLWKHARGEMTRLACVEENRVLLAGNRRLMSLDLEKGKPAWKKPLPLPRGVSPSGTGFASNGKYYLPLTSAEVIAIDLADGRIVSRAGARDGLSPGNLICHRGAVISQNGEFLDCFDQIDVLRKRSERRLAKKPDDVDALRTLGEVAYNEGRLSEAISLLERAYRAAPDDVETRDVLAECLAAALDEDFVGNRSRLALLKELDDGGMARRMLILRIEAQGLLQEGNPLASAAACLELYRLAGPADEWLSVGREHQAAASRWVEGQLAAIWAAADDEQRKTLQIRFDVEIKRLGAEPRGDELARLLEFFGGVPVVESLKLARARELSEADQWLEAQQLLLNLENSDDESIRAEAVARIASRLHGAGLHTLAASYDQQLKGPLAGVKCLEDLTGRELVEKWAEATAVSVPDWPKGRVDVRGTPTSGGAAGRVRSPMWGVRLERTDSILGSASGQLSTRGGELVMLDSLGREFFSANLESENQVPYRQPGSIYGVSRGNLLVVSLGRQLAAFNTLASPDGLASPVLWRVNLGSTFEMTSDYFGEPTESAASRPGSYRAPRPMDEGKWIGVIGPVTGRGVVYQDQRRLVCVDALSGDIRWSRTDVPQGCDLFGDEHFVFAVPTGSTNARIYSAIDGRALGKAKVPAWREQLVTRGREVICWKTIDQNRLELSALDARTGDVVWRHEFEPGAGVDVDMGRYVAVVVPSGRAVVIDAKDGTTLVDQSIPAKTNIHPSGRAVVVGAEEGATHVERSMPIHEVHLIVSRDNFLVIAKHDRPANMKRSVRPFNMVDSPVIDGQLLLFERTTGKMRWSRPAEVVQQALILTQPVDLPFILFAGMLTAQDGGGSRNTSTMLILDKATGRTLFAADDLPQSGAGQCVARVSDAAARQAAVEMAGRSILLQFTSERRPPEPPAMAEVESGAGKSSGGLMGIMLKLGGS